jgi:hypothetical protein
MTPHIWRHTTILDDEMSLTDRARADRMGQAKFLKDVYVSRGELQAGDDFRLHVQCS